MGWREIVRPCFIARCETGVIMRTTCVELISHAPGVVFPLLMPVLGTNRAPFLYTPCGAARSFGQLCKNIAVSLDFYEQFGCKTSEAIVHGDDGAWL